MAPAPPTTLRTLAFGDLERGLWGAGWFPAPGQPGVLLVATAGEDAAALEATLEEAEDGLRVAGAEGELRLRQTGEPLGAGAAEHPPAGLERRGTVSGTLTLAGRPVEVTAPGRSGEWRVPGDLGHHDSVREVSAWFDGDEGAVLLALRPRKHKGQEQDAVAAAVLDPEGWPPVSDPRLSTTYSTAGRPRRMTLELWAEDPEVYPRRVAGEATGAAAQVTAGGWDLIAELLLCHSRGHDGAGVYLLARPA